MQLKSENYSLVLVELRFADINPCDTYVREGKHHTLPVLPYTPGNDGAGVVKEIGARVTTVKPSDNVFFMLIRTGSYAQFCTVEEQFVKPLGSLSFEQGAAIGIPYYTAVRAIHHCAKNKVGKDKTVLVHGASGAVGLACVQAARALDMDVYGTAGSEKGLDLVKKHGAIWTFNHRESGYKDHMRVAAENKGFDIIIEMLADKSLPLDMDVVAQEGVIVVATENKGFDIIIEMLADKSLPIDMDVVAQEGVIVIVGCRGPVEIEPRICMQKECFVTGVLLPHSKPEDRLDMDSVIQDGIQAGWLQPHVSKTYSLEDAPQSHIDIIKTTAAQGKIVFKF